MCAVSSDNIKEWMYMEYIFCGCAAFILFILHDLINNAYGNKKGRMLFFIACGLLIFASVGLLMNAIMEQRPLNFGSVAACIIAAVFFLLLIYTLFFALPFHKTYVDDGLRDKADGKDESVSEGEMDGAAESQSKNDTENFPNKVCDTGVYALCRHPGVLWLIGFYLFLSIAFPERDLIIGSVVFSLLDIVYVILQDLYIFPRAFSDYDTYSRNTPFLIPNMGSVTKCFHANRRRS